MIEMGQSRVLVTGGAGFIGSALVWGLNRRGTARVVIADRLGRSSKWRNLRALRFEDYVEADRLIEKLEADALGTFDFVLHMGACSSTTEQDASYLARNNYEFSQRLCGWALQHGARFLYASSRDQDLLGRVAGLRFFNVFGPNEDHKGDMRSVVHKAFSQVRDEGVVRLFRSHHPDYRDGEQRRDFVYVKDVVEMTLHLAAHGVAGLFNVGSGEAHTWLDLVRPIFAALGREERIEFVDMPATLRDTYQYHTQADVTRLRATGYSTPPTPLDASVTDYVRGYLLPGQHLGDEA